MRRSGASTARKPHPVDTYADAVLVGTVPANHWVRLAAQRHRHDRAHGQARGLTFDAQAATAAIQFFPDFLRHHGGAHAGKPFELAPYQVFLTGSLFGWQQAGVRRFRHVFLEASKGNGKSPWAAGVALAALFLDEARGAEIYCAAVTREQARIQFLDCVRMLESAPDLRRQVDITENNVAVPATGSYIRPVSSEARALDGKRVSVALIDELMEHPSGDVLDKVRAGVKAQPQPLIVMTTNSGYDRHGVAWRLHEYSTRVLEGVHTNDAWLAFVAGLDPCGACRAAGHEQPNEECVACDAWTDERVWPKANPLLDLALPRVYLREQVEEALAMPSKRALVQRLNFSLWTSASVRWIPVDTWAACGAPVDPATLAGQPCIAGLDLSETHDLSALVLLFGAAQAGYTLLPFFFCPEDDIRARAQRDHVPYDRWQREGALEATPGAVVDYTYIRRRIAALGQTYRIRAVCYDPWRAKQLALRLEEDGIPTVAIPQTLAHISPAARELERLLAARLLRHGDHPIMSWNAASVVVETDSNGNIRPSKRKSTERVDGIVAVVIALAGATAAPDEAPCRITVLG